MTSPYESILRRVSVNGNGRNLIMTMRGESHRVYWQQWTNSGNDGSNDESSAVLTERSRRDLITSSAAVRISDAARAQDVTRLLREALFPSTTASETTTAQETATSTNDDVRNASTDSLVLVGSLYSLPRDYIQFEHDDETTRQTSSDIDANPGRLSVLHVVKTLSPEDNPLQIWDYMLKNVHHRQESIQKHRTKQQQYVAAASTISPKLQWFFVPGHVPPPTSEKLSNIPSYIDLEGYCSSMDDDEDGDDKLGDTRSSLDWNADDSNAFSDIDDDGDNEVVIKTTPFPWQCPNIRTSGSSSSSTTLKGCAQEEDQYVEDIEMRRRRREQRLQKQQREQRRSSQIYQYQEHHPHCKTGFLLLQSQRDLQVWRQVYCVLTGEYLWFVSRLYFHADEDDETHHDILLENVDNQNISGGLTWANHGRIPLARALLLEHPVASKTDSTPRILLGLEIVQANGTSHVFRASSRRVQQDWIQALSRAMSSCHENSLFEHAQVIVEEEIRARYQRLEQVAVHPLWEKVSSSASATNSPGTFQQWSLQPEQHAVILPNGNVMNVLRLGVQVASYREQCRHAKQHQQQFKQQQQEQAQLASPTSVVNKQSSSMSTPQQRPTTQQQQNLKSPQQHPSTAETATERLIVNNVRATWDAATILLARATQVAVELQTTVTQQTATTTINNTPTGSNEIINSSETIVVAPPPKRPMSRSLETLCRHIDYVITGRLRPLSPVSSGDSNITHTLSSPQLLSSQRVAAITMNRQDPAPVDLFDPLLSELQSLAVTADLKVLQATINPHHSVQ